MDPSPLAQYLPLAVVLGLAGVMAFAIPQITSRLGPKSTSDVKSAAFECGNPAVGSARQRFAVKFYVVALLFIVFDIEAVFLYPWAVNMKALGWFGYVTMLVFASTLVLGLVYVWKKGALEWES
jgi:NADH-quinone oxidoreductase subunit A